MTMPLVRRSANVPLILALWTLTLLSLIPFTNLPFLLIGCMSSLISNGLAVYGAAPLAVSYYKRGGSIYRRQGTVETAIATDVTDFQLTFQDLGQSISISVTFVPRFQFSTTNRASVRDGTATYSTTLLRNKRQN